jgi:hypothetical protein
MQRMPDGSPVLNQALHEVHTVLKYDIKTKLASSCPTYVELRIGFLTFHTNYIIHSDAS